MQFWLFIMLFQEERGQVLTTTGLIIAVRMFLRLRYFLLMLLYT